MSSLFPLYKQQFLFSFGRLRYIDFGCRKKNLIKECSSRVDSFRIVQFSVAKSRLVIGRFQMLIQKTLIALETAHSVVSIELFLLKFKFLFFLGFVVDLIQPFFLCFSSTISYNIPNKIPQVGLGRIESTQTLTLSQVERDAVTKRPSAQMYQPQIQEEKSIGYRISAKTMNNDTSIKKKGSKIIKEQ